MQNSDSESEYESNCSQNFVIVQFDDGVQLVHRNWLNGEHHCYWPSSFKSSARYDRAVKTGETPGVDWKLFSVQIVAYFSTWDGARRKLKTAEEKSDVNTTDVEDKNSRKIRKRYSRASSYSNSDEEGSQKYTKVAKKISKPPNPPSVNENSSAMHRSHVNEILTSVSDQQNTCNSPSMNLNNKHVNMVRNEEGESTPCTSRRSTPLSHLSSLSTGIRENPTINDYDWRTKLDRDLTGIKMQLRQILLYLNNNERSSFNNLPEVQSTIKESEIWACLPLRNATDMEAIEKKITESEDYKSKLISVLARSGGNSAKEIVKSIFRKIMLDDLALQYSWLGGKGKTVLSTSPLSDVIFEAVRSNNGTKNSTDVEIISEIKNWLRHAPQRAKSKRSVPPTTT